MRQRFILAFIALWFLTTGSSCQTSFQSSNFSAQGQGLAVVAVVLVAGGIFCLADERCGAGAPTPRERLEADFQAGRRSFEAGDRAGLARICVAAQQGSARAQYYYGAYLLRRDGAFTPESLIWLERAAAQGHKAAAFVLYQAGGTPARTVRPLAVPRAVPPPALRACARRADGDLLEARGAPDRLPGQPLGSS